MILSNQIKCLLCEDVIYSAHKHDFVSCKCGAVCVDGGMNYLKRCGSTCNYEEQSFVLPNEVVIAMTEAGDWCLQTGRNGLGIASAIARAIRDSGYEIVEKK